MGRGWGSKLDSGFMEKEQYLKHFARIEGIQDTFSDFSKRPEKRTQHPSPVSLRMLCIPFLLVTAIGYTFIGETVRWLRKRLNE